VTTAHFTGTNGTPDSTTSYYMGGQYELKDGAAKKYYSIAGMMVAVKDSTGALQYLLTDHLGSTVAVTNASGTLTSQQRYLPFGAARSIPNSPILGTDFGYTGQRLLDAGMGGIMDYKARFYSPYLNHFTQPDTIVSNPYNPQAWNRFSYVGNNPIRYNDPTGHCRIDDDPEDCFRPGFNNPPSFDDQLKEYGVTVDKKMGKKERRAILEAVILVGEKFAEVRDQDESAVEAFKTIYGNVNFTWGGEDATGMCSSVSSGGCTSNANQINFWSMSNDMVKNVVHELGHAFYHAAGNPLLGNAFSRDALIRNASYGDDEALVWEQHPISMNKDGKDIPTELFADTFIAWTYGEWNKNPLNVNAVTDARNEMDRIASSIP